MAIVADEWLSQNANRAYPFRENAPRILRTSGGSLIDVQIPNGLFVDTLLTVPENVGNDVHLSRLSLVDNHMSLTLGETGGDDIGSLAIDLNAHTPYSTYAFAGAGDYADIRGNIALGDTRVVDLPSGAYTFNASDAPLALAAVRPSLRGVQSLRIEDVNGLSDLIQQHVRLQAGTNIRLRYIPDLNAIRIDALSDSGFSEQCNCDEAAVERPSVERVNGIRVSDVQIKGDGKCTKVEVSGNTITIKNICSDPCCGCKELDAIRERIELTSQAVDKLEGYVSKIEDQLTSFRTGVLHST